MKSSTLFGSLFFVSSSYAQSFEKRATASAWGQCAGIGYAGATDCAPGSTCVLQNAYYSQCVPSAQAPAPVKVTTTQVATTPSSTIVKAPTSTSVKTTTSTTAAASTSKAAAAPQPTSPASNYTPSSGLLPLGISQSAIATFYGGNWDGGACLLTGYNHGDMLGLALGSDKWAGSAGCGACIEVTGKAGTVVAMVMDKCPECKDGHLDLETALAAKVDGPDYGKDGIFNIKWKFVTCPISGNLQFRNKEGSGPYYFALQVRNHKEPIDKLEVSNNNGASWTTIPRTDFNYFTNNSGYGSVVDVRITSTTGKVIVQKGLNVVANTVVQGSSQF